MSLSPLDLLLDSNIKWIPMISFTYQGFQVQQKLYLMHLPSTMSSMKNNSEDEGAPMEEHQTQKAEVNP